MREALLAPDDVRALLKDLQTHARVINTSLRSAVRQQTPSHSVPVEAAVEQLLSHAVNAIQIRYHHDGWDWTDTLLQTGSGFRLVRCQHPSPS
jgi:hypothetical protein